MQVFPPLTGRTGRWRVQVWVDTSQMPHVLAPLYEPLLGLTTFLGPWSLAFPPRQYTVYELCVFSLGTGSPAFLRVAFACFFLRFRFTVGREERHPVQMETLSPRVTEIFPPRRAVLHEVHFSVIASVGLKNSSPFRLSLGFVV